MEVSKYNVHPVTNMPNREDIIKSLKEKHGANYLGWVRDYETSGWANSPSCFDIDLLVALIYDREAEFGVRCVAYANDYWDNPSEYRQQDYDPPFHYDFSEINIDNNEVREFLQAACTAYKSQKEVQIMVKREADLDEQTMNKNEIFYHRGSKPPQEFRFLGSHT